MDRCPSWPVLPWGVGLLVRFSFSFHKDIKGGLLGFFTGLHLYGFEVYFLFIISLTIPFLAVVTL
jgi:hypothetical protein